MDAREQVREAIAGELTGFRRPLQVADVILSLKYPDGQPMIEIRAQDQTLPKGPYTYFGKRERTKDEETQSYCAIGYSRCQQDMSTPVDCGDGKQTRWVKIIENRPEGKEQK